MADIFKDSDAAWFVLLTQETKTKLKNTPYYSPLINRPKDMDQKGHLE